MANTVKIQLKQPEKIEEYIAYASFDTEPSTNNRSIAVNNEVTKQELDSLFSTKKYERPYQPEYFNPLEDIIGELWTPETEALAFHYVFDKVSQFIPRITISNKTSFTYSNYTIYMNLIFYYANDFSQTLYDYERSFDTVVS